jgi:hypothetical protein
MATTVVNPQPASESNGGSNGMGFILGIILILFLVVLFFIYILPLVQQSISQGTGTQVNVPKDINVNVDQKK